MKVIKRVTILLMILLYVPVSTACHSGPPGYLTLVCYGFNQPLKCDEGILCLKDIFLTEEIKTEEQNYRSETIYLIVRIELDFHNFSLQECGVTIYNYDSGINEFRHYPIRGNEDLDLPLTEALSTDLHLDGEPGPVRGTAWFCFHIPAKIKTYLYEKIQTADPSLPKPLLGFELEFNLNHVGDPDFVQTSIGCDFYQIEIYETYSKNEG